MIVPDRLASLADALSRITNRRMPSTASTLGELGVDSRHLVELMVSCDEIYEAEVAFELLDISIDTSVAELDRQIQAQLAGAAPLSAGTG